MNKYMEKEIDIRIDDNIFSPLGLGALNFGITQSLTQIIANSLDWRQLSEKEKYLLETKSEEMKAIIRVNKDSIEIWDNGIGMTLKELNNALKFGFSNDTIRKPIRKRKGIFGMGLILALLNIGWKFTIRTKSIFEKNEYEITINTRLIESKALKLSNLVIKSFESSDVESPMKDYKYGTYICISDLLSKKHKPEIWRQELGRNFSPEIESEGVKIIFIDNSLGENIELEPCRPEVTDIFPETKVHLEPLDLLIVPEYGDNKIPIKIRGWVALRQINASGSGRWGLHTFYRGQLIEAFHNDGPTNNGLLPTDPHPTIARIHGEIHLDMCLPTFTKLGWNTELKSWSDAKKGLKPILEELVKAARAYRKNKRKTSK